MFFCDKCGCIYKYIDNFEKKVLEFKCIKCNIVIEQKKEKIKLFSKIIKKFN